MAVFLSLKTLIVKQIAVYYPLTPQIFQNLKPKNTKHLQNKNIKGANKWYVIFSKLCHAKFLSQRK